MNLSVERATRLGCSEEMAAAIPALAGSYEICAKIQRDSRSRRRAAGGCRAGCNQDRGALNSVGASVLKFLSSAPDDVVRAIKLRLGASVIRFSVDGVVFER